MRTAAGLALLTLCVSRTLAVVLDLTAPGSSGFVTGSTGGTAFLQQDSSLGPARVVSFVRLVCQAPCAEQGYNTSGRPVSYDEVLSITFTHDLTLGQIPMTTLNGGSYYEFLLDINQTNTSPRLTLDAVQIYTAPTGGRLGTPASLGDLRWDMGANSVLLNYAASAGLADVRVYIPAAPFQGLPPGTFVYLYSHFGGFIQPALFPANDGFEQWGLRKCGSADFNGDGDVGTDEDIADFFACLAGACCATCGSIDFNADRDVGTDADIESFFRVLGGAAC